jgi:hypothetical protein
MIRNCQRSRSSQEEINEGLPGDQRLCLNQFLLSLPPKVKSLRTAARPREREREREGVSGCFCFLVQLD